MTLLFEIDCLYMDESFGNYSTAKRLFFQKLMAYALIPLFIGIIAFLALGIVKLLCKKSTFKISSALTIFIIGFFIFYPHVVNYMFRNFKCVDLDGSNRLFEDFEIVCWD